MRAHLFVTVAAGSFCVFAVNLAAQTIDFEQVPTIGTPQEGQTVDTEFATPPFNVTFLLLDQGFNPSDSPVVAVVGGQDFFAFQGPYRAEPDCRVPVATQVDMPAANQQVGCRFLTDDGVVAGPPDRLFVSYSAPVAQASGDLLDIDGLEAWRIRAYDQPSISTATSINHIGELTLCSTDFANANPSDGCSGQATGDGVATRWSFSLQSASILGILFEFIGKGTSVGLAFDNFSPSSLGEACDSICCAGACCIEDGTCVEVSESACSDLDGLFFGEDARCAIGACGVGDVCVRIGKAECSELGGLYQGDGSKCE